ncbi:unnamed protein product [Acanthosepion pharaonis]|uniref:Uncharacterized protein n=1 Tax=Acanthosepion pharaonis TaxID=158019 RepID=A0A812EEL6_ACAPH|nr:unnamed protein product [Sepia pharaonis]
MCLSPKSLCAQGPCPVNASLKSPGSFTPSRFRIYLNFTRLLLRIEAKEIVPRSFPFFPPSFLQRHPPFFLASSTPSSLRVLSLKSLLPLSLLTSHHITNYNGSLPQPRYGLLLLGGFLLFPFFLSSSFFVLFHLNSNDFHSFSTIYSLILSRIAFLFFSFFLSKLIVYLHSFYNKNFIILAIFIFCTYFYFFPILTFFFVLSTLPFRLALSLTTQTVYYFFFSIYSDVFLFSYFVFCSFCLVYLSSLPLLHLLFLILSLLPFSFFVSFYSNLTL